HIHPIPPFKKEGVHIHPIPPFKKEGVHIHPILCKNASPLFVKGRLGGIF
ncbi:MAG: hypothetical protein Greene101415_1186, partial [Parcubacteria group bacterium Greene1014_15]